MRILIVDNYAPFARSLRLMLSVDHDVSVAGGGAEGLAFLRAGPGFDAILCDLLMPDVTGMDVFRALRAERPGEEARILFMTGGAHTDEARDFLAGVPNPCLEKPFAPERLDELLRERTEALRAGAETRF